MDTFISGAEKIKLLIGRSFGTKQNDSRSPTIIVFLSKAAFSMWKRSLS